MLQTSFLYPKIKTLQKYDKTKDLKCVGYTQDKVRWAVKRETDKPGVPLAEWIAHHLCRYASIPTPEFSIVECPNGELAFGSRWEQQFEQIGNATPQARVIELLTDHAAEISAIHGVDIATVNPDRHAGNFLFVPRADSTLCLAFDFSQAYPTHSHPFGTPLPACSTLKIIVDVLQNFLGKFDHTLASTTLARVKTMPRDEFKNVIDSAPPEWFTITTALQITQAWDNFRDVKPSVPLPP